MSKDKLPTLAELIPVITGDTFTYQGDHYVRPEKGEHTDNVPDHGIIRCGFRVYEILEWISWRQSWKVRPFECNLTERQLMLLSEQTTERSAGGEG